MASEIQTKVAALQGRIFMEEYFPNLWCNMLAERNMSTASIDQHEHTDGELTFLCHYFWEALPDASYIRTGPFFELCDIAEQAGDF